MLNLDTWQEIFSTLSKNKLRAILTGFSVAWGIFMLIILLGSGNGFENAMRKGFSRSLVNSMRIFGGKTTKPYQGLKPGRYIGLTNEDYDQIKKNIPEVELISSLFDLPGQSYVAYKGKSVKYRVSAAHPDYITINKIKILEGRSFNNLDIIEKRKVVGITKEVKDELFGKEIAVGEYIIVNGFNVKVIGIFEAPDRNSDNKIIALPISTAQLLYGGKNNISYLSLTIPISTSVKESQRVEKNIRSVLSGIHSFDPEDERAIYISNSIENAGMYKKVLNSISLFVWVICIMTIVAGIVGVSNIMTVVVKERTREIGIRKAIGARPFSIISMIMQEAVLITSVSGFTGLLFGTGLLEFIRTILPENQYFYNPEADIRIAVSATVFLIAAGLLAGFFPARKAAKIKPIVALRDE